MKRLLNILVFCCLSLASFAQEEMRVVDSLLSVLPSQEGREKVLTMIELTWEFYEVSYDDCLDWGEKAIKEAQTLGLADLEADATYAMAMQYGYHADLDLAQEYLKKAFDLHRSVENESRAFEDLWNQAYFEHVLGNLDSAFVIYEMVLSFAEQLNDTLAMANTYSNIAAIQYQKNDFEQSEVNFMKCRTLYMAIHDELEEARANANLANIYMEWGKFAASRKYYKEAISAFERLKRYDFLLLVYKNYGLLFEKDYVNYDSASYYFGKAMACVDSVEWPTGSFEEIVNVKADLLVEMGHMAVARHDELMARDYFEEAFSLSEDNSYHFGMMQAALSMGQLYAAQGKAALSMHYLDVYAEESRKSGITMMESEAKKPLILNYARLGRFDEMVTELEAFDEQRKGLQREINDLYDQVSTLQDETQGLLQQYDSQNNQIETLQSQRNHYRLAFFGLLAIVLFVVVLLIAYKIVRKKRAKVEKG